MREPCAIAAPDLSIDDRRPDRLFAAIICGIDPRIDQEPEPVDCVPQQMAAQTPVWLVRESTARNALEFNGQAQSGVRQRIAADAMATPSAVQVVGPFDQIEHRSWEFRRDGRRRFQQPFAPALQVIQALLMRGDVKLS